MSKADPQRSNSETKGRPERPHTRMTFEAAEQQRLGRHEAAKDDPRAAKWNLACFYRRAGQLDRAFRYLKQQFGEALEDCRRAVVRIESLQEHIAAESANRKPDD